MQRTLLSACTLAVLWMGTTQAQERPNFTGTWVKSATSGQTGDATTLKITDTPALLTVERMSNGQAETLTFSFIGEAEALRLFKTSDAEAEGPTVVQEAKAYWHGTHLDMFIARQINGKTVTQNIRYLLDSGGASMTVEQDLQIHHGYESLAGAASQVAWDTYIKS